MQQPDRPAALEPKAGTKVFISFVHEDKSIAVALQSVIEQELHLSNSVFLSADQSQVLAGHIWFDRIRDALRSCGVLVLLLSGRSLRRAWVNFEAGAVWLTGRPVIPVCLGTVSKGSLPQPYAGMQAVDLNEDLDYLLSSIHQHLGLNSPPPLTSFGRLLRNAEKKSPTEGESIFSTLARAADPRNRLKAAITEWEDELHRRRLSET